ncbi:mediator of RNA polymerase II transcription subunit 14 isoform X3 [Physcomitrium patens]|uniref:Mediator of RNA polymerase II transcription subunit 14 n=1 Tax=Physcomitrium patens TaxID=3218 RepID=A0A2K1K1Z2_PHYPA|nr:mediator of RNA polymerase II transcription subunit 14-like isoform X3 [Physcomitrium patens]PNR47799.1 hypothetical protein PHYPA_012272 [Physcomitrium patens]|eukprot:XP_024384520.1 mediator of RNA polymerase II transcription subunit 14-like isoform X3 [Physcomitrella patens]
MAEAAPLGSVDFSVLVRKAAEASVSGLKELTETAPELSDTEKKIGLLKYIVKTRQRLLRIAALTKWCRQIPLVERCQQLSGTLSNHDMSFTQAADFLFYLHETLQQARAPVYDIPSATEILLARTYNRLPKCIEDLGMQPVLIGEEREGAVKKLNSVLRTRLLDIELPKQITDIKVTGGRVIFKVAGEFEAHLTLGYRGHLSYWRVLKIDILVGEPSGPTQFTDPQAYFLGDELERRMAASEDPLGLMYSILHQFCTALVMDTLFRQIKALLVGRWRDAIKYEKLSDTGGGSGAAAGQASAGQGTGGVGELDVESGSAAKVRGSPGLKIMYWLETQRGEVLPSLRIEHGADQQIRCSHSPAVMDSATGMEAEFAVDSSCINVEKLLLRAIACSVHTRLLEVQRGLKGGVHLWQSDNDVVLRRSIPDELESSSEASGEEENVEEAGEEVLCVRAFGVSHMALGISIRNGRFLLRCPSTVLAAPMVKEMEDALNLGSVQALDIFMKLRAKCLVHYFGLIGKSLNLKLYERGASSVKLPADGGLCRLLYERGASSVKMTKEGPKLESAHGGDVLIMGFPDCDESFFLCVQLDANFTPLFTLLEAESQSSSGQASLASSAFNISRWMRIDIEAMSILRDDTGFSLLEQSGSEGREGYGSMVVKRVEEGYSKLGIPPVPKGPIRGGGLGLDGGQSGLDQYYGGGGASHKGNMLAVHSPSNLQGGSPMQHAGSPLQHGNVGYGVNAGPIMVSPSMASGGYHQGKSLGGSPAFGDGSHRLGRAGMVNGASPHNMTGVSPLRSPMDVRNQMSLRKSPLQSASEQEPGSTRSPVAVGDNATSPIELDDEHITKLIDSISSKTSGSFATTDSPSRQGRHVPQARGGIGSPTSRPLIGKAGSPSGSQLVRASGLLQASSPGWKSTMSPSGPYMTDSGCPGQDVEQQGRLGGGSDKSPAQKSKQKRSITDLFNSMSSVQALATGGQRGKRQRTGLEMVPVPAYQAASHVGVGSTAVSQSVLGQSYGHVVRAANQGKASAGAYRAVFQQVEERCRLCIKHARLTRQMDAQGISYVNEVGLREPSTVLRFRLPDTVPSGDPRTRPSRSEGSYGWQQMGLCLGKPGSEGWDVKVQDAYFSGLWKLQKQKEGVGGTGEQFASPPQDDSHMKCTQEGLVLKYSTVLDDSVTKLVKDLERIWRARAFALRIRKLLGSSEEEKKRGSEQGGRSQGRSGSVGDTGEAEEKKWEVMRRAFRVEAVGLTSVSFTYVGTTPGIMARFVVEWGTSRRGCTVHSPEQLWPHTKFLEDYINGGEVELLLDAIQVTAGPLHALAAAIRPARMAAPASGSSHRPSSPSPGTGMAARAGASSAGSGMSLYGSGGAGQGQGQGAGANGSVNYGMNSNGGPGTPQGGMPSNSGRNPGPGLVPSTLLPTDVSVLLRSAYWIRIVYRRDFAIDMRCFAGDQVWLQPAPPPRSGGKGGGGSLPCPQFRTFVVEHVTLGMSSSVDSVGGGAIGSSSPSTGANSGARQAGGGVGRAGNSVGSTIAAMQGGSGLGGGSRSLATGSGVGGAISIRAELNPALVGMGDDGGYGGAWVPLAALKKVLRGTLRYLGGLWLFAQFPGILREVLASTLNQNEGALLNHDPEQPALRFFIRGCVFAVSMHRQQLFLQAINVNRYKQQQQAAAAHQQAAPVMNLAVELSLGEMQDIGDFFARSVASEPYDASRLASFVTMLTLPVPVLREFLILIQWKVATTRANGGPGGDVSGQGASPRPQVELSLESQGGGGGGVEKGNSQQDESGVGGGSQGRSSITHNHHRNTVEFTLTFTFDASSLPQLNVAGGAGWLPQSVALRLAYAYGEGANRISLSSMDGSHGGRSCWARAEEWERCKEGVMRAVQAAPGEGRGRLRVLAEQVQMALQTALTQIGRGAGQQLHVLL